MLWVEDCKESYASFTSLCNRILAFVGLSEARHKSLTLLWYTMGLAKMDITYHGE